MKSARPAAPYPPGTEKRGSVIPLPFVAESDVALVQGLCADNAGAKAVFFARYAPEVERLITHLIGLDRELADILQEVFVQALSSVHGLRDPAALKPWLFRIATHCARRTLRSRSRRSWLRFFVDSEEEKRNEPTASALDVEGAESVEAVYAVLRTMPANERIAFALRHIDGMELMEVAAACSVSLATIKRRLRRAEERFFKLAHSHPTLRVWVEESSRWQDR
jgi:RNA polymerase sigma-70 factor, ECF subfamily